MPKKRQPPSLLTKPSSTAPAALSSTRTGIHQNGERASNVNDLLQQLRSSQRAEHVLLPPFTMASVHPSLRNILDVPQTAAPRPRQGARPQFHGPTRVRRIPGPPPPQSWLSHSRHAAKVRNLDKKEGQTLQHQSIKLPEAYLVDEKSLQHAMLKALASNWNWHAEHDHAYLTQIPLRLRETLLSYLSIFRAGDAQLYNPLQILFLSGGELHYDINQDETQEVKRLDLTNALGRWLSLKALKRAMVVNRSSSRSTLPQALPSSSVEITAEDVPESWEDVIEGQPIVQRQSMDNGGMFKSIQTSRFSNLRHLSLALDPSSPVSAVSWSGLLGIATHLHTVESLSLAYWPLPTYTPEAAATYATVSNNILGNRQQIAYGGTNMYSAQDNDWRESTGILKSLSRSLYCLKWLDLTGCVSWIPALVWEDPIQLTSTPEDFETNTRIAKTIDHTPASIWNGYWRGIVWLGLGVGWTPSGKPEDNAFIQLSGEYNTLRQVVDNIAKQIRQTRLVGKGQPLTLECGPSIENTRAMSRLCM